jgi:hypothetical protein
MVRLFSKDKSEDEKVIDSKKEESVQAKEEVQPQIVEREINLSLLNEKLNVCLNLLQHVLSKLEDPKN